MTKSYSGAGRSIPRNRSLDVSWCRAAAAQVRGKVGGYEACLRIAHVAKGAALVLVPGFPSRRPSPSLHRGIGIDGVCRIRLWRREGA